MVYITLDELKEILPEILDQWIDEDDESWEWIFQEIEQKCHISKKFKSKKWKKKLRDDVDELTRKVDDIIPKIMGDFDSRINAQTKRIDELSNKISNLSDKYTTMVTKTNRMELDITATKSIAKTAKQRTEVDYTKCSKEKSDADVIADVVHEAYDRMIGRGATKEELDSFRNSIHKCDNLIQKYNALEKKEIPVVEKMCATCKSYENGALERPCSLCCYNGINTSGTDKWEADE